MTAPNLYRGNFYSGAQGAGDVLREIFAGIQRTRDARAQQRDGERQDQSQAQARQDRLDERSYQHTRDSQGDARQAMLDQRSGDASTMQIAQSIAELRRQGIRQGSAPTDATTSVDLSGLGGVGAAAIPDRARYAPLTPGFYEDRNATPDYQAQQRNALYGRIAQRAVEGDRSAVGAGVAAGMNPATLLDLDPAKRDGSPQALAALRAKGEVEDVFDARKNARLTAGQLQVARVRADAKEGLGRQIPPKVVEDVVTNEATMRQIDNAIALLDAQGADGDDARRAIGTLDGFVPTFAQSTRGKELRSALSNVGSLEYRSRSGQAVTASEEKRLRDFIPSRFDSVANAMTKLKQMRAYIADETQGRREAYSPELGFRELPAARVASPRQATSAGAAQPLTWHDVPGIEGRPR